MGSNGKHDPYKSKIIVNYQTHFDFTINDNCVTRLLFSNIISKFFELSWKFTILSTLFEVKVGKSGLKVMIKASV